MPTRHTSTATTTSSVKNVEYTPHRFTPKTASVSASGSATTVPPYDWPKKNVRMSPCTSQRAVSAVIDSSASR